MPMILGGTAGGVEGKILRFAAPLRRGPMVVRRYDPPELEPQSLFPREADVAEALGWSVTELTRRALDFGTTDTVEYGLRVLAWTEGLSNTFFYIFRPKAAHACVRRRLHDVRLTRFRVHD